MLLCTGTAWAQSLDTRWPKSFVHTGTNELLYRARLDSMLRTKAQRGGQLRVMHIGDSHVRGRFLPNAVENGLRKEMQRVAGLGGATKIIPHDGLYFSSYGINGAITRRFCSNDMIDKVAMERPDIIIISFGTNEAHMPHYSEFEHTATLRELTQLLRQACPKAMLVFTTPPGSYINKKTGSVPHRVKGRRGRYRTVQQPVYSRQRNENTERVTNCIKEFCEKRGIAVWDLFNIAGGDLYACENWRNSGMLRADNVHYTAEGYTLQGKMLAEALLKVNLEQRSRLIPYTPPTPREQRPYKPLKSQI